MHQATAWMSPDFDDSAWETPRLYAPVNGHPWTGLSLRAMPLMVERDIPLTLLEMRQGVYPTGQRRDAHLALREGWLAAATSPNLNPPAESGCSWTISRPSKTSSTRSKRFRSIRRMSL